MRTIGYQPAYHQNAGEFSVIRQVGRNDYPRFHLHVKEDGNEFVFNLHLDQKKPSYKGSAGHSGEYDGPIIKEEAKRIIDLLQ